MKKKLKHTENSGKERNEIERSSGVIPNQRSRTRQQQYKKEKKE